MFSQLQRYFDRYLAPSAGEENADESRVRLATAALFVEMTRADFTTLGVEDEAVLHSLEILLGVESSQAKELLALAKEAATQAVELFQFTKLVDDAFSLDQKAEIVEGLWTVAMADSHVDHHEEYLVRRVADLIHVPHREFIAAKKRAREKSANPDPSA